MANTNRPFGLSPQRSISGTWGGQTTRYYIRQADTNAYYIGDVVLSTAQGDANGVPGVIKATAGTETLRGAIVSVEPANQLGVSIAGPALNLENTAIPATKTRDYYVYVADDPNTIFTVQGDATATLQLATNSNKNFSLTIAAGATPQSSSATVMNSGSLAVGATLNIKAMGLMQGVGQVYGAFAVWQCKINLHELGGPGTAGV